MAETHTDLDGDRIIYISGCVMNNFRFSKT